MNPETRLERYCVNFATKKLGIASVKLFIPSNIGFPDRMFFIDGGKPLFVEFKKPNDTPKLRQTQKEWLDFLLEKGYNVVVCNGFKDFLESLKKAIIEPQSL